MFGRAERGRRTSGVPLHAAESWKRNHLYHHDSTTEPRRASERVNCPRKDRSPLPAACGFTRHCEPSAPRMQRREWKFEKEGCPPTRAKTLVSTASGFWTSSSAGLRPFAPIRGQNWPTTSRPATVEMAVQTFNRSMLGEMGRTEPSASRKLMVFPACRAPQPRLQGFEFPSDAHRS